MAWSYPLFVKLRWITAVQENGHAIIRVCKNESLFVKIQEDFFHLLFNVIIVTREG